MSGIFSDLLGRQQYGSVSQQLFDPSRAAPGSTTAEETVEDTIAPFTQAAPQAWLDAGLDQQQFEATYGGITDPASQSAAIAQGGATFGALVGATDAAGTSLEDLNAAQEALLNDPSFLAYEESVNERATTGFEAISDAALAGERNQITAAINAQVGAGSAGLARSGITDSGLESSMANTAALAGSLGLSQLSTNQRVANEALVREAEGELMGIVDYRAGIISSFLEPRKELTAAMVIDADSIFSALGAAATIQNADEFMDLLDRQVTIAEETSAQGWQELEALVADIEGSPLDTLADLFLAWLPSAA